MIHIDVTAKKVLNNGSTVNLQVQVDTSGNCIIKYFELGEERLFGEQLRFSVACNELATPASMEEQKISYRLQDDKQYILAWVNYLIREIPTFEVRKMREILFKLQDYPFTDIYIFTHFVR